MAKQYSLFISAINRRTIVNHLPEFSAAPKLRDIDNQIALLKTLETSAKERRCMGDHNTSLARDLLHEYSNKIIKELSLAETATLDSKVKEITDFVGQVLTMCGVAKFTHEGFGLFILAADISKEKLGAVNAVLGDMYKLSLLYLVKDVPNPPAPAHTPDQHIPVPTKFPFSTASSVMTPSGMSSFSFGGTVPSGGLVAMPDAMNMFKS